MSFVVDGIPGEVTSLGAAIELLQAKQGLKKAPGILSLAAPTRKKLAPPKQTITLTTMPVPGLVPAGTPGLVPAGETEGMSTAMKVGLALAALVALYFLLREQKPAHSTPVHDTEEAV